MVFDIILVIDKPKVLYHGSPNKGIKIFEPRAESVRDKNEGSIVFATPSEAFASTFLVPADDSWTKMGRFDNVFFITISDRERYEIADQGGAIYTLPLETFDCNSGKGMGYWEWASRTAVKPLAKTDYRSGLETMIEKGVQVLFVDQKTFGKIVNSDDHGNRILRSLRSENQRVEENVKTIPTLTVPQPRSQLRKKCHSSTRKKITGHY